MGRTATPLGPTALWAQDRSRLFSYRLCVVERHGRLVAEDTRDGLWVLGQWYRTRRVRWGRDVVLLSHDRELARAHRVGRRDWSLEDLDGVREEFRRPFLGRRNDHLVDGVVAGQVAPGPFAHSTKGIADLPALPPLLRVFALVALVDAWREQDSG